MGFVDIGLRHLLEDCRSALTGHPLPEGRRAYVLADLRTEMAAAADVIARIAYGGVLGTADLGKLRSATWLLSLLDRTRPDEAGLRAGILAGALSELESGRVPGNRVLALSFVDELLAVVRARQDSVFDRHMA